MNKIIQITGVSVYLYALTEDGRVWRSEMVSWDKYDGTDEKESKYAWVEYKPAMFITSDGTRTVL